MRLNAACGLLLQCRCSVCDGMEAVWRRVLWSLLQEGVPTCACHVTSTLCSDGTGVAPPWQCVAAMRQSPVEVNLRSLVAPLLALDVGWLVSLSRWRQVPM